MLCRWTVVWSTLLTQDVDRHPSEFSIGLPVHQLESVDSCIPDRQAVSEDESAGLQVVCAAAVH